MSEQFLVKIEDMAFRGYGVARVDGRVIFIPFSAKGDEGWVEIVEEKKNYAIGKLKQITQPSAWRVDPPCPYFGVCGGCQWQHIHYPVHGEIKKGILHETLRRLGKQKNIPPITAAPSPRPYGYRVRVQLKVEKGRLGYYRERSHQLVEIDHCPIAHPFINQIINLLRKEVSSLPPVEDIEINVSPEEGKGVLVFHVSSSLREQKSFTESMLRSTPILKGLVVTGEKAPVLFGSPFLNLTIPSLQEGEPQSLKLRSSPGSFYQVNPEQNQALVKTVLEFAEVKKEERVLDLYAGIGNLTLPLATQAVEVWGIEENKKAVQDARSNAKENGIESCGFTRGSVEDVLDSWDKGNPDVVVLDPPRAGCNRIMPQIAGLKPTRIVYVSCDPATFARDVSLFSEKGFELRRVTLIDMFPQSYHMEVVGLLIPDSNFQITSSK
jgi:23S rRNA (uracil1939-C5)-methyltransferase